MSQQTSSACHLCNHPPPVARAGDSSVETEAEAAAAEAAAAAPAAAGVQELVQALAAAVRVREEGSEAPFLFYIDHCFAIRGQGTVLTGG